MIQFHTPNGVFSIDPDTCLDEDLEKAGMTRENLDRYLQMEEDASPIKQIEKRLEKLEKDTVSGVSG